MAISEASIDCTAEIAVRLQPTRVQELTDLITRYLPHLRRMAFRQLGSVSDAEDAVQDALLSALTHLDQFRGQAQMSTWLMSILINSARMKLRRRPREVHLSLDTKDQEHGDLSLTELVQDVRPGPEEICRGRELTELFGRLMRRLSPTLRQTLQLRAVHGFSIRETAKFLGLPVGTTKSRIARARLRLKEMAKEKVNGDQQCSEAVLVTPKHEM